MAWNSGFLPSRSRASSTRRAPLIGDREREHAVEALDAGVAVLLVGVDDGFGVGLGAERWPRASQVAAQLAVVVDLAVEDDPDRAVLVGHRLLAAGAVDDGQAPVAERHPRRVKVAAAVGAAMVEPVGHRP